MLSFFMIYKGMILWNTIGIFYLSTDLVLILKVVIAMLSTQSVCINMFKNI